jgi:hypothetical protein
MGANARAPLLRRYPTPATLAAAESLLSAARARYVQALEVLTAAQSELAALQARVDTLLDAAGEASREVDELESIRNAIKHRKGSTVLYFEPMLRSFDTGGNDK